MATTQQPNYVTTADGRRITYERWKYEQTVAQEAAMRQVNDLITAEAAAAANVGAGFDQSEFGALLRSIVPQLLDQYGRVNATAALQFYDAQRTQWAETYGPAASQMAGRGNVRAQGSRYAVATTQSALAVSQGYAAQYADDYRRAAKADSVINYAMRVRQSSGHAPSVTAMNNALTREVAMYHRDTVLFNAGLDPFVNRVQRVAQAKACEFCRLMALGSTNGTVRTSTYAVKFHSHCHCTIQPLFDGDQPVRPDHYDEFEKEYAQASKGGGSSQDILANWRGITKAKTAPAPFKLDPKNPTAAAKFMNSQRALGFSSSNYTDDALIGFRSYTRSQYTKMNGLLRNPLVHSEGRDAADILETQSQIAALDKLLGDAPALSTPFLTYRDVAGVYQMRLQKLQAGDSFEDLGYVSSAINPEYQWLKGGSPLRIEIDVPAGTKGILVDGFKNEVTPQNVEFPPPFTMEGGSFEWEFILPRGTRLEVIEAAKDGVLRVRVVNAK